MHFRPQKQIHREGVCEQTSRVFTSAYTGRKYMASVVGLADGVDFYGTRRLAPFYKAWAAAWPGLYIRHQPTFLNHLDLRGYGCMVGHYLALVESVRYLRHRNETCDYHLIFEDDAVPFNGTKWPGRVKGRVSNDLDMRLDDLKSIGGHALVLGGSSFFNFDKIRARTIATRSQSGVLHVEKVYGSFAYVFDCTIIESVANQLAKYLQATTKSFSFEPLLWNAFAAASGDKGLRGVHVSIPLIVDHKHGFSATWNVTRERPQEGKSVFW